MQKSLISEGKGNAGIIRKLPRVMSTVELFSGSCSFSKVAESKGHKTFTVDKFEYERKADLVKDILEVSRSDLPKVIDMLWISPPCTNFSVCVISRNWANRFPKNSETAISLGIVLKCLELIEVLLKENPHLLWYMENPRGMLRTLPFMAKYKRNTITYCQYGDTRQKPTDIWTNDYTWVPRPMCSPSQGCHESSPRGTRSGTQGLDNAYERSIIPPALFKEILRF